MKGKVSLLITLMVQMAGSAAMLTPPVIGLSLLQSMGLPAQAIGFYMSLAFLVAAIVGVFAVALVRRVGPIRTSQICLLVTAAGMLCIATLNPWFAALGAALVGAGTGPLTPASSDILARTTPVERYALVFSLKQTGVPLGGALAGVIAPTTMLLYGNRAALYAMAGFCLLTMFAAQLLRHELDASRQPDAPWPSGAAFIKPIRYVLQDRTLRVLCAAGFAFTIVQHALGSYLVIYLMSDLGLTLVAAGAAFSVAQTGGIFARIGWSVVADRTGKPMQTLLGVGLLMMAATALMAFPDASTPRLPLLAILVLLGATAVGWNGLFLALIARTAPPGQAAAATSGCLFFTFLSIVISPPLFGAWARLNGSLGFSYATLSVPIALAVLLMMRQVRRPA